MSSTISLNDAKTLTHAFQNSSRFTNDTISCKFDKDDILDILDQDECVELRVYNALDDSGNMTNVLVGVDSNGEDMTTGPIVDIALRCRPHCPTTSVLMK